MKAQELDLAEQNEQLLLQIRNMIKENDELVSKMRDIEKEKEALEEENKKKQEEVEEWQQRYEDKEREIADAIEKHKKQSKASKGERFKMVTVLFSDVKGFTKLAQHQDAEFLIDELDNFFFHFDNVVKELNVKKIKAIGDTYMCAGGIPKKNRTNPIETVLAALEMQHYMKKLHEKFEQDEKKIWQITTGIHTGAVTATVSGKKKVTYDIKGDTVNIASRIESASEPGIVTISAMTYEFVGEYFRCEYRGKLPVKYKGDIGMYHVKGLHPKYSSDREGLVPNHSFNVKFALIQYDDLEEIILDRLEKELPKHLYYHNLKHTIDVVIQVEVIGSGEGITDEELLLLKTAALFHDMGHTIESKNHEKHSCTLAREILKNFTYTEKQIETICEIIMATQLPPQPKNKLQEIICDADLDYLGRRDFIPVSDTLYKELKAQNMIGSLNEWNKMQVKFLSNHQFFTDTANKIREVNKQKQIERLKKLIV